MLYRCKYQLMFFVSMLIALCLPVKTFAGAFGIEDMSGPHYQVNIIGVSQGGSADMTDSNRRTIFVPLNNSGEVVKNTTINYVKGEKFQVLDGNALDGEALISVPYESCSIADGTCLNSYGFDVFAIPLGKPGGSAKVTAACSYDDTIVLGNDDEDCTDTLDMGDFEVSRDRGKPKPKDISDIFTVTGCVDTDGDGACDSRFRNEWIFNIDELDSYYWGYDNAGLKLLQIRFYEKPVGT